MTSPKSEARIFYVSNSNFAGDDANVIQVFNQCIGFLLIGAKVFLVGGMKKNNKYTSKKLEKKFGTILTKNFSNSFHIIFVSNILVKIFRKELAIALFSIIYLFKNYFILSNTYLYSRNLFFSYLCTFFKKTSKNICHEHHMIEKKFYRSIMQKRVADKINSVFISRSLKDKLHHNNKGIVLHDCGPSKSHKDIYNQSKKINLINNLDKNNKFNVGYFGTFREGSGSKLIQNLAHIIKDENVHFHIFGKIDPNEDILKFPTNLKIQGTINHKDVYYTMSLMDILIMPYQNQVLVGKGIDTAQVMSPLKLFEYFSSGIPIISSDLPVLREVMIHNMNCLLVHPEKAELWKRAILKIKNNQTLRTYITSKAKKLIEHKFNWEKRASKIIGYMDGI